MIASKAPISGSIKKSTTNAELYVFHDHRINRTKVALYFNVNKDSMKVVLKDFTTNVLNEKSKLKHVLTNKKGIIKAHFKSSLTFKYISSPDEKAHTDYFEYMLPGIEHKIIVHPPDGKVMEAN